jgi:dTDP-4-amino-4,6-dideoxygalactose transaminase
MSDEGYELAYVREAFEKNWIAPLGENVNEFEKALGDYLKKEYVIALSSGTAALHLAMVQAGVGKGDLVFCQDMTFVASVNPVDYLGAQLVLIDSERESWNMDPAALEKAIELYGVPKAVEVVHLCGIPADMDAIRAICDKHGIVLIEDAAEALGATYHGSKCGTMGDYSALSFNGNKIITTSGGGALVCSDREAADHVLKLATQAREDLPWYEHREVGFNYRLSNVSAGIGRGQMQVLEQRLAKKRLIFEWYSEKLAGLPLQMQPALPDTEPNRWLTAICLQPDCGVTAGELIAALEKENIEARYMWKPMHTQPRFTETPFVTVADSPETEEIFDGGVCLPSGTQMTEAEVDCVCAVIRGLFKK